MLHLLLSSHGSFLTYWASRFQTLLDQLTYPPKGKINLPNGTDDVSRACDLFDKFYNWGTCFTMPSFRLLIDCWTVSFGKQQMLRYLYVSVKVYLNEQ